MVFSVGCNNLPLEHGDEIPVDKFSLDGAGTLKLTYKKEAWGQIGAPNYRHMPLLYYNDRLVESEFQAPPYSNIARFPIDPEKLSTINYVDFRNTPAPIYERNKYRPGTKLETWIIYVRPDEFSPQEFENIVKIFRHYHDLSYGLQGIEPASYHRL